MIKIKLEQLVNSTEALQKLSQVQLKARLALEVSRMLKEAERELGFFNDARMNLINKYGEKDENGQLITDEQKNCKIGADVLQQFSNELQELLQTEVEINANKFNLDDFGDINFTPSEMSALESFIEL